jgi:hypothetical protein
MMRVIKWKLGILFKSNAFLLIHLTWMITFVVLFVNITIQMNRLQSELIKQPLNAQPQLALSICYRKDAIYMSDFRPKPFLSFFFNSLNHHSHKEDMNESLLLSNLQLVEPSARHYFYFFNPSISSENQLVYMNFGMICEMQPLIKPNKPNAPLKVSILSPFYLINATLRFYLYVHRYDRYPRYKQEVVLLMQHATTIKRFQLQWFQVNRDPKHFDCSTYDDYHGSQEHCRQKCWRANAGKFNSNFLYVVDKKKTKANPKSNYFKQDCHRLCAKIDCNQDRIVMIGSNEFTLKKNLFVELTVESRVIQIQHTSLFNFNVYLSYVACIVALTSGRGVRYFTRDLLPNWTPFDLHTETQLKQIVFWVLCSVGCMLHALHLLSFYLSFRVNTNYHVSPLHYNTNFEMLLCFHVPIAPSEYDRKKSVRMLRIGSQEWHNLTFEYMFTYQFYQYMTLACIPIRIDLDQLQPSSRHLERALVYSNLEIHLNKPLQSWSIYSSKQNMLYLDKSLWSGQNNEIVQQVHVDLPNPNQATESCVDYTTRFGCRQRIHCIQRCIQPALKSFNGIGIIRKSPAYYNRPRYSMEFFAKQERSLRLRIKYCNVQYPWNDCRSVIYTAQTRKTFLKYEGKKEQRKLVLSLLIEQQRFEQQLVMPFCEFLAAFIGIVCFWFEVSIMKDNVLFVHTIVWIVNRVSNRQKFKRYLDGVLSTFVIKSLALVCVIGCSLQLWITLTLFAANYQKTDTHLVRSRSSVSPELSVCVKQSLNLSAKIFRNLSMESFREQTYNALFHKHVSTVKFLNASLQEYTLTANDLNQLVNTNKYQTLHFNQHVYNRYHCFSFWLNISQFDYKFSIKPLLLLGLKQHGYTLILRKHDHAMLVKNYKLLPNCELTILYQNLFRLQSNDKFDAVECARQGNSPYELAVQQLRSRLAEQNCTANYFLEKVFTFKSCTHTALQLLRIQDATFDPDVFTARCIHYFLFRQTLLTWARQSKVKLYRDIFDLILVYSPQFTWTELIVQVLTILTFWLNLSIRQLALMLPSMIKELIQVFSRARTPSPGSQSFRFLSIKVKPSF